MKRALMQAVAAALVAAPIGWVVGGFLKAASRNYYGVLLQRPLYAPGEYLGEALLAAALVGGAVLLWSLSRRPAA